MLLVCVENNSSDEVILDHTDEEKIVSTRVSLTWLKNNLKKKLGIPCG